MSGRHGRYEATVAMLRRHSTEQDDPAVGLCMRVAADDLERLEEALDSMVRQFGYSGNGIRTTGGLSALEEAFDALGWDDPSPLDKEEMCDEPGCTEPTSCGFPTPNGYRRTCGKHYREAQSHQDTSNG